MGVATVVCKLFNMVQMDVAVFGKKDYQQLLVIRRMVEDLCIPVEVVGVDTVREGDGLAMSSRNGYLTPEERQTAPALYASLQQVARGLHAGEAQAGLLDQATAHLTTAGMEVDYLSIRSADDLSEPAADECELVILAAAYLGKARLIDNLEVQL